MIINNKKILFVLFISVLFICQIAQATISCNSIDDCIQKARESPSYSERLEYANKAIEFDANNVFAWQEKSYALNLLHRYDEALIAKNRCLELNPNNFNEWEDKGQILYSLERYDEALIAINKSLQISEGYSSPNLAALELKGMILYQLGRCDEALDAFNKVNELSQWYQPENAAMRDDCITKIASTKTGFLSLTSSPSGASVSVDGSYQGTTPLTLSGQTTGSHTVRITKSGYNDYSTTTTVIAGQTANVIGSLIQIITVTTISPLTTVPTTVPTPTPIPAPVPPIDSSGPIILLIIGIVVVIGGYIGYKKMKGFDKTEPPSHSSSEIQKERVTESLSNGGLTYPSFEEEYRREKEPTPLRSQTKIRSDQDIPKIIQQDPQVLKQSQSRAEQIIFDQLNEIRNNPVVSSSTKSEMNKIANTIRGINLAETEKPLKTYAKKQLDSIDNTLNRIHQKNMIFTGLPDNIRQMINAEQYVEAIVESDKFATNLDQVEQLYDKATSYRTAKPDPDIVSLYNAGNYELVIKVYEEKLAKIDTVNKLRARVKQLNEDADKVGSVPDSIKKNLQAQDIETLEKTINDLDSFIANAKPELTLSLDRTQLSAERWHKLGITLTNTGLAHVDNVAFEFSSEFETKGIKPISVKAGESSRMDIRILPKNAGNILLDVTLIFKDLKGTEYRVVQEISVDVVEKGTTTSPPSETPSSPVSQFTPKPLTPKQLPTDLSDRYTESEFIGKGGFARVFKAKRKDGKFVAVKIPISMDAITGKSFIAEMQNWTKLSHPNIVRLFDFNIMPMPYFEEELCDSALAELKKPLECEEAVWILFNVCEGLKFAHDRKIIHRDLKPQNILLKNGVPKISDWGLSRIISESTSTTATSFTPYYAAPEQINNRVKNERTDIWQLGVILYELVTGKLPFQGDSMIEIGMGIATKDPIPPGKIMPETNVMDSVVMKCLEKDPAKRYQSVLELQKDLAIYLRKNYAELLKTSVSVQDSKRSAYYCGDLVMINLITGDIPTAYKYLLDLVHYSKGDVKVEAQELAEQIKMRMEMGVTEIPEELIQKAEILVHQVSVGFRNKG